MTSEGDHAPLWPLGFTVQSLEKIREICVDSFTESRTRSALMDALEQVVNRLFIAGVSGEVWLDGSFVTKKPDPIDIDFILIADSVQYDQDADIRKLVDLLIEPEDWPPSVADTSVVFRDPPESQSNFSEVLDWWERRFGSKPDKGLPKGVVIVRLGEADE